MAQIFPLSFPFLESKPEPACGCRKHKAAHDKKEWDNFMEELQTQTAPAEPEKELSPEEKKDLLLNLQIEHYQREEKIAKRNEF